MSRNNHDVSEEKLKELQRREALSDSDEYDIQDKTYERAPITRQYVKDDVIVKGAEFVDDEEDDIVIQPTTPPVEEDVVVIPEFTPLENKYIKTETKKPEPAPKQPKPMTVSPYKPKLDGHPDSERDYIDRENAIYDMGSEFEKVKKTKPKKEKKELNFEWVKPALSVMALVISFLIAFFLFSYIRGMDTNNDNVNYVQDEYVSFIESTNSVLLYENNACKEFRSVTEQFIVDVMEKEDYMSKLKEIKQSLLAEVNTYSLKEYSHISVYDIRILTVEYVKNTTNAIDMLLALEDADVVNIKMAILNNLEDRFNARNVHFNNIVSIIHDTASTYEIESKVNGSIIYLNIQ